MIDAKPKPATLADAYFAGAFDALSPAILALGFKKEEIAKLLIAANEKSLRFESAMSAAPSENSAAP